MHATGSQHWKVVPGPRRFAAAGPRPRFDASSLENLPEPARRYLRHSIRDGARLSTVARLTIDGSIRLSRKGRALDMRSVEWLAPREGYDWRARIGAGLLSFRGFDRLDGEGAQMRWSLWGWIPVVRASGPDLARSARGRLLGERVFVPTTLLPSDDVRWEGVDDQTAAVQVSVQGESTTLTLRIDESGRLQRVSYPRWNSDARIGPVGYLDFVCDSFSEERQLGDYTLPTRFRAGWRLGQPDEFAFFFGHIKDAAFE